MTYVKQQWVNGVIGGTPINADRLAHMEDGIEAAQPIVVVVTEFTGSAIQSAINSLPLDGGIVELAAGDYDIPDTIYMLNLHAVTVRGQGASVAGSNTRLVWSGAVGGTTINFSGCVGCHWEGVGFYATQDNPGVDTTQTALRSVGNGQTVNGTPINGCFFNSFSKCYFENYGIAFDLGVSFDQVDTFTFHDCFFYYGPAGIGVVIRSANTLSCHFDGCTFATVSGVRTTATAIDAYLGSFSMIGCITAGQYMGVRARSSNGPGISLRDHHSEEDDYPIYTDGDGTGGLQFAWPLVVDDIYAYAPRTALFRLGNVNYQYYLRGVYTQVGGGSDNVLVPDDPRCVVGFFGTYSGTVRKVSDNSVVRVNGIHAAQGTANRTHNLGPVVAIGDTTVDDFGGGVRVNGTGGLLCTQFQDVSAAGTYFEFAVGKLFIQPRGATPGLGIGVPLSHTGATVGFNSATPVGKRTLGNAATDAATTQTLANNLRQALIDLGLGQT